MQMHKCSTPGCINQYATSAWADTGKCPICVYREKIAKMKFQQFKAIMEDTKPDYQTVVEYAFPTTPVPFPPFMPFAEVTPADPALEAIGRAFDDAIDLAYLG